MILSFYLEMMLVSKGLLPLLSSKSMCQYTSIILFILLVFVKKVSIVLTDKNDRSLHFVAFVPLQPAQADVHWTFRTLKCIQTSIL